MNKNIKKKIYTFIIVQKFNNIIIIIKWIKK